MLCRRSTFAKPLGARKSPRSAFKAAPLTLALNRPGGGKPRLPRASAILAPGPYTHSSRG